MITMQTVAEAAGVSTSTVSHVLNKTRHVHPDTERAVREAIARVGYSPNLVARSLAAGTTTKTIGVAIAALSNHYFAAVVHAIEAECARRGLMMLLTDTHEDPDYELKVVQALHERRVDGILIAPTADPARRVLNFLRERRVPAVLVDRFVDDAPFDQVAVENRHAAESLVRHAIELGHRRIAFVAGADGLSTTVERVEGYRAALAAARLPFDPALVVHGESRTEPARAAVAGLLALRERPTALVSANNLMTLGAMRALHEAGLRVPEQMSLLSFDDFEWADVFAPRLTVIAQPVEALGTEAVRLLARRIAHPDVRRQAVQLAPVLRVRDSAAPLPAAGRRRSASPTIAP